MDINNMKRRWYLFYLLLSFTRTTVSAQNTRTCLPGHVLRSFCTPMTDTTVENKNCQKEHAEVNVDGFKFCMECHVICQIKVLYTTCNCDSEIDKSHDNNNAELNLHLLVALIFFCVLSVILITALMVVSWRFIITNRSPGNIENHETGEQGEKSKDTSNSVRATRNSYADMCMQHQIKDANLITTRTSYNSTRRSSLVELPTIETHDICNGNMANDNPRIIVDTASYKSDMITGNQNIPMHNENDEGYENTAFKGEIQQTEKLKNYENMNLRDKNNTGNGSKYVQNEMEMQVSSSETYLSVQPFKNRNSSEKSRKSGISDSSDSSFKSCRSNLNEINEFDTGVSTFNPKDLVSHVILHGDTNFHMSHSYVNISVTNTSKST